MRGSLHQVAVATVLASMLGSTTAHAQTAGNCDKFDWPLAIEQEWFAATDLPTLAPSPKSQPAPARGFVLTLNPSGAADLPVPPSRPDKVDSGHAGFVAFDAGAGQGDLQVTLSADGWIDVIQDGAPLPPRRPYPRPWLQRHSQERAV
jgi:hypothetical protein